MAHNYLCDYARTTISCTARRLVGRHGFQPQDREDIEQDLACDLLARLRNFDPKLGSRNAFIARRVEAAASNLIRKTKAGKRQATFENEAPDAEAECGFISMVDIVVDESLDEAARVRELRQDVETVLSGLPSDLRSIADDLKHGTERSVAAKHRISRRQLRNRIEHLRDAFTRMGMAPAN